MLLSAFAAAHDVAWLSLSPRHRDAATLADAIGEVLQDGTSRTLVLDDVHHVRGPALDVIRRLLADEGEELRVVIASRADPDLVWPACRLEERLLEVRAAELAFTEDEAAAMLRLAGLDLSPAQVERLVARTEGWAAGQKKKKRAAELAFTTDEATAMLRLAGLDLSLSQVSASCPDEGWAAGCGWRRCRPSGHPIRIGSSPSSRVTTARSATT